MTPTAPADHRVLVPVDVLGGQTVPASLVDAFASVPVVLLGYREIPDQTAPGQARAAFAARASAELAELRAVFEQVGATVETRLAFTHDRFETIERAAVRTDCDAVLLPNPAPVLERVLVAIRGNVNVDHVARLVAAVVADTTLSVTLFHVAPAESDRRAGERPLETSSSSILERAGVDRDRIERRVVVGDDPTAAILEAAVDHDLLVAGESRPSVRRLLFRDRAGRLARRTVDPVLVIRGEYLEPDADDGSAG